MILYINYIIGKLKLYIYLVTYKEGVFGEEMLSCGTIAENDNVVVKTKNTHIIFYF